MKKQLLTLIVLFATNVLFAQVPSYVPTTGLLAWYNFNNSGANANNASLNTLANYGATFVPDRFGNVNAAAFVDGLGAQWMQLANPTFTFSQSGAFTYSVWVKKSVQPSSGVVIMSGNLNSGNFISNIQGGTGVQFGTCKQQSPWTWLNCTDTIGAWMHLVGTYSNTKMKLYRVTALYNSQVTTGISNQEKNQTVIYPNPTKNTVSIKLDLGENKKYIITNNQGKSMSEGVITGSDFKVDLTEFPSGVYYLNVVDSPLGAIKLVKE